MNTKLLSRVGSAAFFLVILTAGGAFRAEDANRTKYEALRDRVKEGDKAVDFGELRLAFGQMPDSATEPDPGLFQAMSSALKEKKYAEAMEPAQKALERDFVDIDAHWTLYKSNQELNNLQQAEFHQHIFEGLCQSIMNSGDGKSIETAYTVISQREEQIVFMLMKVRTVNQIYQVKAGHAYDVFDTVGATGDKRKIFFNVDISVAKNRAKYMH
jgi:hypothetical protein